MYINRIKIENFRQLNNVTLCFEKNTTILAGPNNSGKTTLINLLKKILNPVKFNFGQQDIPIVEINKWCNSVFDIFKKHINTNNDKDKIISNIISEILPNDNKIIIPECKVKFQIDYSEDDDIRNFMDYVMDLDNDKFSFYFIYSIELNISRFAKMISENYSRLQTRFNNKNQNATAIRDILIKTYAASVEEKCYFADAQYQNMTLIEVSQFRKLFNFESISAGRSLDDDDSDDGHSLSKRLLALASKDEKWKEFIKDLPDKVLAPIQQSGIDNEVKDVSTHALNETINALSETNGNYIGTIALNMDIEEEDISDLLNKITCAKYNVDQYSLNESSQGLGYSNLIYMHIEIQKFIKTIDPTVVNLFFIEEPESHMHPQMQNVFIKYLLKHYEIHNIQGLITTHSNEIVKYSSMSKLRVIRTTSIFKSEIFNLGQFKKQLKTDSNCNVESKSILENFYDWFFEIGYSEIVFADAAILYEGDTERLYMRRIITKEAFTKLQEKYIAFIQVGGAYAYNFRDLIDFLKIKTLIITDIDYLVKPKTKEDILASTTTNSTIAKFYCNDKFNSESAPKNTKIYIKDLYEWIKEKKHIVSEYNFKDINNVEKTQELIYLAFQTECDNYARTLEAAMLAKKFSINAYDEIKRSEWIENRDSTNLEFSVPNNLKNPETKETEKNSSFTLRDILESTSNGKTDFMYSVIMNGLDMEMLPTYIEGGLKWLMK